MIPQTDPKSYYLNYKQAIDEAISRTLASGWYILGREVEAFENEFASYLGVGHAIGAGSGTDALQLALRCFGIGPGDVVATVSHTAVATVAAIQLAGATPLLVDIDPNSYTMDPSSLENALANFATHPAANGRRVRAVIPVHLYGHPADMQAICEIANRYGLYVLEDCAQATGAVFNGQKVGNFGHIAAFSFYPTKNLGALGDGGALVTNDSCLMERGRQLREYGWKDRESVLERGMNSRLDEIQAAVLRVRLVGVDEDNIKRQKIADYYSARSRGVELPSCQHGCSHVYHQYVIRSPKRDELKRFMGEHGVATAIHYPIPVHRQPAFKECLFEQGSLSITESVCGQIISMPIFPELSLENQEYVCRVIEEFMAQ